MKYPCEVVRDLLPLYHDKVCSSASRQLVEEHLAECGECKAALARLSESIPGAKYRGEFPEFMKTLTGMSGDTPPEESLEEELLGSSVREIEEHKKK